jgi:hypothetical protein
MTDPDVLVNDVFVDPADPDWVLMATDRGGVMASTDPKRVYAGVVNDKTFGGVFASSDGGAQ